VSPPNVIVATDKSPDGQVVPIQWVDDALESLVRDGSIEVSTKSIGYRSAFVGAVLMMLPGAHVSGSPPVIALRQPDVSDVVSPTDEGPSPYPGPLKRPALVQQRGEQGPL